MKFTKLLLFSMFMILFSFAVSAAECGSTPTDSCTVSQDTTFNAGTYILPGGISITANNVDLNCNGAKLQGSGAAGNGIEIIGSFPSQITIINCNVTGYAFGIHAPITLSHSVIKDNSVVSNEQKGIVIGDENFDIGSSTNATISSNIILDNKIMGIHLRYTDDSTISNNQIKFGSGFSGTYGVIAELGSNNIFTLNIIEAYGAGIDIAGGGQAALNNQVTSNTVTGNGQGINLHGAATNTKVSGNILDLNNIGVNVAVASNSDIHDNAISQSTDKGLEIGGPSSQNALYRNNFLLNAKSALDMGTLNLWNNTEAGNYYDNYDTDGDGCLDANLDNICDDPYDVNNDGGMSDDSSLLAQVLDFKPQVGQFNLAPPPAVEEIEDRIIGESDEMLITVVATGYEPLTYSATEPNFMVTDNILRWQTNFTDSAYGSQVVRVIVKDANNMKTVEDFRVTINNVADTECASGVRNSCTVSKDTAFASAGSYNFKDGIRITGNGITLDCAGSTFDGAGFLYVADGIKMNEVNDVTLQNCNVENYDEGVRLQNSLNNLLTNIQANHNRIGIYLQGSDSNRIQNSAANENVDYGVRLFNGADSNVIDAVTANQNDEGPTFNSAGISVKSSSNNVVRRSTANQNDQGIQLMSSSNNKIEGNAADENRDNGVYVESSPSNIFEGNSMAGNSKGMTLFNGANNLVIMNNFINNINFQAQDFANSIFDQSSKGNHWSNFDEASEGCFDTDSNNVCDTPYIFTNNQDDFPSITAWTNSNPSITSSPPLRAQQHSLYQYDVDATDPEADGLVYGLVKGPPSMVINAATGLLTWQVDVNTEIGPGTSQRQIRTIVPVTVEVSDGRGGVALQSWEIIVTPNDRVFM